MMIKTLIEHVVRAMVSAPDDVCVVSTKTDSTVFFEVTVAQKDRGRVIGWNGRTIRALRTLVNALNSDEEKISIDIAK